MDGTNKIAILLTMVIGITGWPDQGMAQQDRNPLRGSLPQRHLQSFDQDQDGNPERIASPSAAESQTPSSHRSATDYWHPELMSALSNQNQQVPRIPQSKQDTFNQQEIPNHQTGAETGSFVQQATHLEDIVTDSTRFNWKPAELTPGHADSETEGNKLHAHRLLPANADVTSRQSPRKVRSFSEIATKLAYHSALVLFLGVGFILIGRRWLVQKQGAGSVRQQDRKRPNLSVLATLKISPKASLHVVEVDQLQVLVAAGNDGVQSMVQIQRSFSDTLDNVAPDEALEPAPTMISSTINDYLKAYRAGEQR